MFDMKKGPSSFMLPRIEQVTKTAAKKQKLQSLSARNQQEVYEHCERQVNEVVFDIPTNDEKKDNHCDTAQRGRIGNVQQQAAEEKDFPKHLRVVEAYIACCRGAKEAYAKNGSEDRRRQTSRQLSDDQPDEHGTDPKRAQA